jgi:hypothetical protein
LPAQLSQGAAFGLPATLHQGLSTGTEASFGASLWRVFWGNA